MPFDLVHPCTLMVGDVVDAGLVELNAVLLAGVEAQGWTRPPSIPPLSTTDMGVCGREGICHVGTQAGPQQRILSHGTQCFVSGRQQRSNCEPC